MRVYRAARRRRRRRLLGAIAATVVAIAVSTAVLGGADTGDTGRGAGLSAIESAGQLRVEPPAPRRIERFTVGEGSRTALVLRPEGEGPQPGIVFLHGFGQSAPRDYGPWLRHLAKRGSTVIAPRYQGSTQSPPDRFLPDAIASIRAALKRAPVDRSSLVVAGHSAGGALAVDLAAVAAREGLPVPSAIFAVYPGRALLDFPGGIPARNEGSISAETRLVVLAGANDQVVGTGPAAQIVERASAIPSSRRRLVRVTDPAVSDHYGPERSTKPARRAFWRPLDRLIRLARQS